MVRDAVRNGEGLQAKKMRVSLLSGAPA